MILNVAKLSKRFENNWVLRDATLTAYPGEVYGLFGISGSGKSTLLRILGGIESNNGGNITLDAKPLESMNVTLLPDARKPTRLSMLIKGSDDHLSEIEKLESILDLESVPVNSVLLLDSLFKGIDRIKKESVYREIRSAAVKKNLIVITATACHDEILNFCDRTGILIGGEIMIEGTPQDIYDAPLYGTVAANFGLNNLFEARRLTSSTSKHPEYVTIKGEHKLQTQMVSRNKLGPINQNLLLGIRPEQIILSYGASFPEDNLLKGVISDIKRLGSHTLIDVDCNGLVLTASVIRLIGLEIGQECMVGLPPDRIAIYK